MYKYYIIWPLFISLILGITLLSTLQPFGLSQFLEHNQLTVASGSLHCSPFLSILHLYLTLLSASSFCSNITPSQWPLLVNGDIFRKETEGGCRGVIIPRVAELPKNPLNSFSPKVTFQGLKFSSLKAPASRAGLLAVPCPYSQSPKTRSPHFYLIPCIILCSNFLGVQTQNITEKQTKGHLLISNRAFLFGKRDGSW